MRKVFNVTGACVPQFHYMVDIRGRLEEMKKLVDNGAYFTVNRARQYGKTTTLSALQEYLSDEYAVAYLDFQFLSQTNFRTEEVFVRAFARELLTVLRGKPVPEETIEQLHQLMSGSGSDLGTLFFILGGWCAVSEKPVVLIVDEVDSAANNQVFLDFLAQLRGYYIHRVSRPAFQSVILASVYDVKNIKRKLHAGEEHTANSPWNIAADFDVEMSFSAEDIAGMLCEYEADHCTGMDVGSIASLVYDYTCGYPFLVSRLCKLVDEKVAGSSLCPDLSMAWTKTGILEAVRILLAEKNALFESLVNKLEDYPKLRKVIYSILFQGKDIPYNILNKSIEIAEMFGFIKNRHNKVTVSNRIFESVLYF